ncbi:hypothetical protein C8R45DRAFT_556339 [Mycena sanguinolenta]|nr:hypothetical protein C8R45DRAFT_556339 [Mycena sanguinolenta]
MSEWFGRQKYCVGLGRDGTPPSPFLPNLSPQNQPTKAPQGMLVPVNRGDFLLGSPLSLPPHLVNQQRVTELFSTGEGKSLTAKTLTEIDTAVSSDSELDEEDDNVSGNCDFCGIVLGPKAAVRRRFFRCLDCGSCILCDSCLYDQHIPKQAHRLEEWDQTTNVWIPTRFRDTGLHEKYATHCSSCCDKICEAGDAMPSGTLMCQQCGDSVLCKECCVENHASKPLHLVTISRVRSSEDFSD